MTGRSRISSSMFNISITSRSSESLSLEVGWDFLELGLPSETRYFLDVDNVSFERRFELKLSKGKKLLNLDADLAAGSLGAKILAVLPDERGIPLIRASSKKAQINPGNGESTSRSPLVVFPDPELTVPWELDFSTGDVRLLVSARSGFWNELKSSPLFKALVAGPISFEIVLNLMEQSEDFAGAGLSLWITIFSKYGFSISEDFEEMDLEEKLSLAKSVSRQFQKDKRVLDEVIKKIDGGLQK